MTEIVDTLDTSQDVVPDPTASEVHPRLAQRSLTPGALNGTIQVGPPGQNGTDGADGIGVPPGGTEGQVLAKADDDDYDTEWVDAPTGGGGGSVVVAGPPITGAATVAPNTFYPINLAANLGNVPITMPPAPDQGTVIEFSRQDSNIFTSTPRITAGAGDNIGDTSPYVISMRNSLVTFTYWGTTWWPAMPVGGASGLSGATPSSAFAPTIMSRDGAGRAQVEDPVAAKDIVNLEYLQAHGGGGGGTDEVAISPDDPTVPEPTVELWVDTDDTSTGVSVPTLVTDWNLAIPGGYYYGPSTTLNAPTTNTYAGMTYTDGQGHYTQVVYRIVTTSTNVEQWQRQLIGPNTWTPWRCIAYGPTDWATTGYLNNGGTLTAFQIRRRDNQVDVYATGNITAAFAQSTTGDYGNVIIFTVPAAYVPTGYPYPQPLMNAGGGPALAFYVTNNGGVGLSAGPPASFSAGQAFSAAGTYNLS